MLTDAVAGHGVLQTSTVELHLAIFAVVSLKNVTPLSVVSLSLLRMLAASITAAQEALPRRLTKVSWYRHFMHRVLARP